MQPQAVVCVACGVPSGTGAKFCQNCGADTNLNADVCVKCGVRLARAATAGRPKSKLAAGLLGVFVGGLGIHRFYLGYTGIGIAQLVLAFLGIPTCGITAVAAWLWGLIEGILILTGHINVDAQGQPLGD
jgi:TM2 domain-containing membrane protein YozV